MFKDLLHAGDWPTDRGVGPCTVLVPLPFDLPDALCPSLELAINLAEIFPDSDEQ